MKNFVIELFVWLVLLGTNVTSAWASKDESSSSTVMLNANKAVIVKTSTTNIINNESVVSFVVNTERAGDYYLSCWMLGGQYPDGSYSSYNVSVNGITVGKMNAIKANWQSTRINTGTIALPKGKNTISFTTKIPEIPNVEFIKLAPTQELSTISSDNYDERLRLIKEKCVAEKTNYFSLNKDTIPTNNLSRALTTDDRAHYDFKEQLHLKYSFHTWFQFTQGSQVNFSVSNVSGSSTILEIFSITNPENYTWSILAGTGQTKEITINIPASGQYKIRARSYLNTRDGIANVKVGTTTYTEIPTYSCGFTYTHEAGIEYNTFTANIKSQPDGEGDPVLLIGEGFPDKIVAYNDDSQVTGEFDWMYNSRIKKIFTRNTKSIFVSQNSSYITNPIFCDLYIGSRSCRLDLIFENLHRDDVIESAPATPELDYNCISWSGGITSYWEWPTLELSDYYVPGNELACFDMFYLYPRYDGCGIYTRNGATEANSVIDLWAYMEDGEIEYTHASIKHGADNHPHGYDWESKAGELSRIFHPRYALEGDPYEELGGYGEVSEYYRLIGIGNPITSEVSALQNGDRVLTLEESIAEGHSVLEHVRFTEAESLFINSKIGDIDESIIKNFNAKYQTWKNTCHENIHSMPNFYKNAEYKELLAFCKSFKKSEFLIYRQLGKGEILSMLLICDLILSENPQSREFLGNIKEENINNRIMGNDVTIVRSPYSNAMKLVKRLINNTNKQQTREIISNNEGITYSNSENFIASSGNNGLSISFNLPECANISLSIIDLQGRILATILQNQNIDKGPHHYLVEKPMTDVCIVCYSVNGNLNVKKVYIK